MLIVVHHLKGTTLASQLKPGAPDGVAGTYLNCRMQLMKFASRFFRRPEDIEDVVQEAFVKSLQAERHDTTIRAARSYLFRVIRNLALNELTRGDDRLTEALDEYDPAFTDGVDIERQVEASERFELFCRAVARLPDVCRRVFVLRRVYGFSQREIAEHLGISIKTVEAHLAKGMVRCTDFMELFDAPEAPVGESSTEHHP